MNFTKRKYFELKISTTFIVVWKVFYEDDIWYLKIQPKHEIFQCSKKIAWHTWLFYFTDLIIIFLFLYLCITVNFYRRKFKSWSLITTNWFFLIKAELLIVDPSFNVSPHSNYHSGCESKICNICLFIFYIMYAFKLNN